jgi:hypothetical protein
MSPSRGSRRTTSNARSSPDPAVLPSVADARVRRPSPSSLYRKGHATWHARTPDTVRPTPRGRADEPHAIVIAERKTPRRSADQTAGRAGEAPSSTPALIGISTRFPHRESRLVRAKCCPGCCGGREPVSALVERMPGVAGDLHQLHRTAIQLGGDRLDDGLVLDRPARTGPPAPASPAGQPCGHAVDRVLAIGEDDDRLVRMGAQCLKDGAELHLLVGGYLLVAAGIGQFGGPGPATRTRVALAGPIGSPPALAPSSSPAVISRCARYWPWRIILACVPLACQIARTIPVPSGQPRSTRWPNNLVAPRSTSLNASREHA